MGEHAMNIFDAITLNNISFIKEYIYSGGNINIKNMDTAEETLLHKAIRLNNVEICRLLIENGADINISNSIHYNDTPIQYATYYGHIDIIKLLINNGANLNDGHIANDITGKYNFPWKYEDLGETRFKIWVNML